MNIYVMLLNNIKILIFILLLTKIVKISFEVNNINNIVNINYEKEI